MSYTDIQLLRKMLSDPYRQGFDEIVADNENDKYQTTHKPIQEDSEKVWVATVLQVRDTDYTIDNEQGIIDFATAPADEALIEIEYDYSVFSDEELTDFLARDGSVDGAMVRCIEILLFDSARRFDYIAGQTDMKPSQVFDHLHKLLKHYQGKVGGEASEAIFMDTHSKHYDDDNPDMYIGEEGTRPRRDLTRDDEWSDNNV